MKKNRRKNNFCLNCGKTLNHTDNYCPECGQENNDNNISFPTLFGEFFSNYFSLDSRFGRTWFPFLFQPGKVTKEFIYGRRVKYANPVRWYLVISLVHFFLLSYMTSQELKDNEAGNAVKLGNTDGIDLQVIDSLRKNDPELIFNKKGWPVNIYEMYLIDAMNKADSFSIKDIMDSLQVETRPWHEKIAIQQTAKLNQSNQNQIGQYIITQLPIIVFFILPFYALLLKLFFYRKGLYIKHLVHTLHIHAYFFIVMSIGYLFQIFGFIDYFNPVGYLLLIFVLYILISWKRVYQQGYFLLAMKMIGLGFLYFFLITIAFIVGAMASLVFY
jgi:hypothetical protein